jgi:hypothetical protein
MLLREVDEHLSVCSEIARNIHNPRRPDRIRYSIEELIRERIFAMAIGCSTQDDLDRLAHDSALLTSVWNRNGEAGRPHSVDAHRGRKRGRRFHLRAEARQLLAAP